MDEVPVIWNKSVADFGHEIEIPTTKVTLVPFDDERDIWEGGIVMEEEDTISFDTDDEEEDNLKEGGYSENPTFDSFDNDDEEGDSLEEGFVMEEGDSSKFNKLYLSLGLPSDSESESIPISYIEANTYTTASLAAANTFKLPITKTTATIINTPTEIPTRLPAENHTDCINFNHNTLTEANQEENPEKKQNLQEQKKKNLQEASNIDCILYNTSSTSEPENTARSAATEEKPARAASNIDCNNTSSTY